MKVRGWGGGDGVLSECALIPGSVGTKSQTQLYVACFQARMEAMERQKQQLEQMRREAEEKRQRAAEEVRVDADTASHSNQPLCCTQFPLKVLHSTLDL